MGQDLTLAAPHEGGRRPAVLTENEDPEWSRRVRTFLCGRAWSVVLGVCGPGGQARGSGPHTGALHGARGRDRGHL